MDTLSKIEEYCSQKNINPYSYQAEETIYTEGEKINGVYFLKEGQVKVYKKNKGGKSVFLWTAKQGESIGLASFFQKTNRYTCTVTAGEENSTLLFLSNQEFSQLIQEYPNLKVNLLKMICRRISFMEMRSKNMLYRNIDEKIIETLLFLASNKDGVTRNLRLDYSIKDLTEIIGASLGYLQKRMRRLKNEKLIDYGKNWLIINDINQLKLLSHSL